MRGKRKAYGLFLGLIGVLASAQLCFGSGFALYEGSARGLALGGAVVGRADDPSALFYNPAGITQLPGLQLEAGATVIMPSSDVVIKGTGQSYSTKDNVFLPPHLYASYQFSDRVWFGLGTFSQFGLGTEFDSNWPGAFNSYKAFIQSLTVNPNIAFKITDDISIAAGIEAVWFDVELAHKIPAPAPINFADTKLTGDSWGYGFNVALHYKPCKWASFGASYRSEVKQDVTGNVKFNPGVMPNMSASGSITLPDMLFLGMTFYPMDRLSWEVGGVWTRWSKFDKLTFAMHSPGGDIPTTALKYWRDTWRFQTGIEYKALDWLDLRAGYIFDEEPIKSGYEDYLVPANDRHFFSVGPGFRYMNWTFDLSYTYLLITDRDVKAQAGTGVLDSKFENGQAHLIGMSIGYKF